MSRAGSRGNGGGTKDGAGGRAPRAAVPTAVAPPLDVVQRWFQAVVTHPAGAAAGAASPAAQCILQLGRLDRGALERLVRRSSRLTAEERLSIYANAYYARLLECLRGGFPVLAHVLGAETFDSFAFDYLQRYPSRSYTLDHLAESFPRFLEETRPDRPPPAGAAAPADAEAAPRPAYQERGLPGGEAEGHPPAWPDFLIDLAILELEIARVFDGPGAEGEPLLAPADLLAAGAGAGFAAACLSPVPCLCLLRFRYPVNAFYSAARAHLSQLAAAAAAAAPGETSETLAVPGSPPSLPARQWHATAAGSSSPSQPTAAAPADLPFPEPAEEHVALSRTDFVVRRHELTPFEFAVLGALLRGATVGEAIAGAAAASELSDDELAARLDAAFRRFTAAGFFRAAVSRQ
jgi:hypothetical protein